MKDIANKRFGRLVALVPVEKNKWDNWIWECRCDCGNIHMAAQGKLTLGKVSSCGCYKKELKITQLEKHGITTGGKPRTLIIWSGMKARCLNNKSISYKSYGAKGVTVCDEWLEFKNFHNWAITHGYQDGLTLDRIDNYGNYEPTNCQWVDSKENKKRQRNTRYIVINGISKSVSDWCRTLKISKTTAYKHLNVSDQEFIDFVKTNFINKFLKREEEELA